MRAPLLPPPRRRAPAGADVPTINVAFLLLIFFLLTARLAAPDALDVTPPEGRAAGTDPAEAVVELDAEGRIAFGALRGAAAVAAAGGAADGAVLLRADGGAPAGAVAALLPRLRAAGAERVALEVRPR